MLVMGSLNQNKQNLVRSVMRVMRRTYEHILTKKTYDSIRRRSSRPQAKLVFGLGEVDRQISFFI